MSPRPDRDLEEEATKKAKMMAEATPADSDTETSLARLEQMMVARREDTALKARYEAERDRLAKQLVKEGSRYFLDEDGDKVFAYPVIPDNLVVNEAEFVRRHEAGEMPDVDLDKVMPRKIDREAMRRAIAKKHVPPAVVVATMRFTKGTARVAFHRDSDE